MTSYFNKNNSEDEINSLEREFLNKSLSNLGGKNYLPDVLEYGSYNSNVIGGLAVMVCDQ